MNRFGPSSTATALPATKATTLLDRDALEMLLQEEDVREAVETAQLGG